MPSFNFDDLTEEEEKIFCQIVEEAEKFSLNADKDKAKRQKDDIVQGLIESKSLNLVYGKKNSGKSLLLVNAALHFSEGTAWAGRNTRSCEVTYYAYEQLTIFKSELKQHTTQRIFCQTSAILKIFTWRRIPDILDKHYLNALKYKIGDGLEFRFSDTLNENSGRVLILDTLAYVIGDAGDENTFATIGPLIKQFRKIIDLGWTIFVLTHPGKDASKGPRGHTALPAAADNIFHITEKNGIISMHQTFARNRKSGQKLKFKILSSNLKEKGLEGIPYIEALDGEEAHAVSPKPSHREVAVLNLLGQLFEADAVNIKLVFGLDRDCYAVQYAQLEAAFMARNIAPQARSKASQAKALKRVLTSLAEKGLINERNGFYWLPENEQTNDDNQT